MARLSLIIAFVLFAVPAKADAMLAAKAWAAWSCSTLASMAEKTADAERTFLLGYDAGKKFLEAARGGKISKEEWDKSVPIGFSLNMQGPTIDFALGRIFAAVQSDTHSSIVKATEVKDAGFTETEPLRKAKAESEYQRQNCHLMR